MPIPERFKLSVLQNTRRLVDGMDNPEWQWIPALVSYCSDGPHVEIMPCPIRSDAEAALWHDLLMPAFLVSQMADAYAFVAAAEVVMSRRETSADEYEEIGHEPEALIAVFGTTDATEIWHAKLSRDPLELGEWEITLVTEDSDTSSSTGPHKLLRQTLVDIQKMRRKPRWKRWSR